MSSTISKRRGHEGERGQVLVLFAGGVLTLLVVAALAYDVGMMLLERRDSQNAADAAALAGARYVFEPDCVEPAWVCTKARAAAREVALANGYDDADPNEVVNIHIPAINGRYVALPNFVEVDIDSERASIFGSVIGRATWPVGVFAVATNDNDLTFPFSMLALSKTACKAIHVSGTGEVEAYGNVQSNSNGADCGDGSNIGLSRTGGGTINIIADDATCRSAGEIQDQGSGSMTCTPSENSFALPDPLRDLDDPAKPALAQPMVPIGHTRGHQDYCPGVTGTKAPSETQPKACDVGGNSGPDGNRSWLLWPGLYPHGLSIDNQTRAYLLPGIYWIGGGGFQVAGDASVVSVSSAAVANSMHADQAATNSIWSTGTNAGGVLIYNTKLPSIPGDDIRLGGGGGRLLLKMLNGVPDTDPNHIFNSMSIYQDRTLTTDVFLNGSTADGEVSGIIYAPGAHVQINGSDSNFVVDQIIADTFKIDGSGGRIEIKRRTSVDAVIVAAGLVD